MSKKRFLIFQHDSPSYHCELIREGVIRYFNQGRHELEFLPIGIPEIANFEHLIAEKSFAIVCWMEKAANLEFLRRLKVPYINLRETDTTSNVGLSVQFSGEGTLAAEYFIDQMGLETLIYIGKGGIPSNHRRFNEFERVARARKVKVHSEFFVSRFQNEGEAGTFKFDNETVQRRNAELNRLLLESPKPAGFFCADDRVALNLFFRAQHLGVAVPEKVSILGVGCLQHAEQGGVQSISVIQMDHIRQGFRAAQMMEQYLTGEACEKRQNLEPDGIIHRRTTIRRIIRDDLVQRALALVDEDRRILVDELADKLNVSTRTLRNHFLSTMNMSISKAIDLERFRHAKQLLRSRRYNHEAVASLAGYRNHKQMLRSFERFVQMTPKKFVQEHLNPTRK